MEPSQEEQTPSAQRQPPIQRRFNDITPRPVEFSHRSAPADHLLPAVASKEPLAAVHRAFHPFHRHVHTHRSVWVVLVVALIGIVVATTFITQNNTSAPVAAQVAQVHIADPNFSLDLPLGWRTNTYKPGAGLSTFYPTTGSGSMVVYVLPYSAGNQSSAAHVSGRISELSQNGATTNVLSTESVAFGATKGSITVVTGTAARDATAQMCYVFANVDYNNVAYNIDVSAGAAACSGSDLGALRSSLGSLRPQTTDLKYQKH